MHEEESEGLAACLERGGVCWQSGVWNSGSQVHALDLTSCSLPSSAQALQLDAM